MSPLAAYGDIGLAVFVSLLAFRLIRVALRLSDNLIPEVSVLPPLPQPWTRTMTVCLLLAACIVAWPIVVVLFLTAPKADA